MRSRHSHKYHAQPTTLDGIRFASKAEARRYVELKLLEKAGEIRGLELQPVFELSVSKGALTGGEVIGRYVADFRYEERVVRGLSLRTRKPDVQWEEKIEDVKGYDLPLAKWKRKHAEAQYGITIELVRR